MSNREQHRIQESNSSSSSIDVNHQATIKRRKHFCGTRKSIAIVCCVFVFSVLNYEFSYKATTSNKAYYDYSRWYPRETLEKDIRMNILLFYADDWTMKVLGKLNPYVKTPNIDRMSDNGILFTNSFVTTSICWISRATMVTGLYSAQHRQVRIGHMALFNSEHYSWKQTLFPLLRGAGYYTGLVGKWHAPLPGPERRVAFDFSRLYYGWHWYTDKATNKIIHVTDVNREDSLEFLRNRPKNKPFALKVSFFATHAWDGNPIRKYNPTNETLARYPEEKIIPMPKTNTEKHWNDLPYFFTERNVGRQRYKKRWEPDYFQSNIRDLYAMASHVDDVVGELVQELKDQGVYNNTLIIFTTDNGDLHGQHGLAEKWYQFEESIRVPLIIQDPRMDNEKHGTVLDEFVLSVDLAPTILSASGISVPSIMQGRDIAELYLPMNNATTRTRRETAVDTTEKISVDEFSSFVTNNTQKHAANTSTTTAIDNAKALSDTTATNSTSPPWRQDFFYEFNMGDPYTAENHASDQTPENGLVWNPAVFALVTKKYKYVYWPQHQYEQIFELETDPYEEFDRMHHPKNKSLENDNQPSNFRYITVTDEVYLELKARYDYLKKWAQEGNKV